MTRSIFVAFFALFALPASTWSAKPNLPVPKLVVVLVIDQFRSDTLAKFESRFLPAEKNGEVGGFRYLMSGAYYPFGEYDTFQCMTGPGHATVLTGSLPYVNGVAQNLWFDQSTQKMVYCAEDAEAKIVGTDKPKSRTGTSPKSLLASTVGDELKNSGYASKVVAIALKDRSSIYLGGHRADLAIWHDSSAAKWVSSTKYLPQGQLPKWVEDLNAKLANDATKTVKWEAKGVSTGVTTATNPVDPKRMWGMASQFPHEYKLNSQYSLRGPYGVTVTADAAISAVKSLKMGGGKHPDLLAVSFSSHDYAAHGWGPNSREIEEITVAEDRELARFFNELRRAVPGGLANVTFVLTADHGGTNIPEHLLANGMPAGRIDDNALAKTINERLEAELGKPPKDQTWLPLVVDFAFYLNRPALAKKGADAYGRAEAIVKKAIQEHPGTQFAVSFTDWLTRNVPPGEVGRRFLATYFPGRSGDVILHPKPYWISTDDSAGHLSSWSFDRYVPILWKGAQFAPGRYAQPAKIIDIAPTLSFLLRTTPPSMSEGRVLHEALR